MTNFEICSFKRNNDTSFKIKPKVAVGNYIVKNWAYEPTGLDERIEIVYTLFCKNINVGKLSGGKIIGNELVGTLKDAIFTPTNNPVTTTEGGQLIFTCTSDVVNRVDAVGKPLPNSHCPVVLIDGSIVTLVSQNNPR